MHARGQPTALRALTMCRAQCSTLSPPAPSCGTPKTTALCTWPTPRWAGVAVKSCTAIRSSALSMLGLHAATVWEQLCRHRRPVVCSQEHVLPFLRFPRPVPSPAALIVFHPTRVLLAGGPVGCHESYAVPHAEPASGAAGARLRFISSECRVPFCSSPAAPMPPASTAAPTTA